MKFETLEDEICLTKFWAPLGSPVCEKKTCPESCLGWAVQPWDVAVGGLLSHPSPFLAWRKHILHQEVPSELSIGPVPYTVASHLTASTVKKAFPLIVHISILHQSGTFITVVAQVGRICMCWVEDIWEISLSPSQSCSHYLPGTLKSRRCDTPMQVSSLWLSVSVTIMSWAAPPNYKFRCTSQKW